MKKIISILLTIVMLLLGVPLITGAAETEGVSEEAMGLLAAIEILPNEINAEQNVTRADFAVYVARLFNVNDFDEDNDRYYIDVPMDHYALTAINYLTERKIVSGNGADYFYPDNGVSVAEACKILIEAAGYGEFANALGGYPTGYLRAAQRFEIIDAAWDADTQLTVANAAELIFNAAVTDYTEVIPADNYDLSAHSEGTLLEIYHDVYLTEGIVEATNGMAVYEDNVQETDVISVNGKKLENTVLSKTAYLLGEYVRAYYLSDDSGITGRLIYVFAEPDETESFTMSNDDYSRIVGTTLYYYDNAVNKERSISLDKSYFIVHNGRPYTGSSNADAFDKLGSGKLTFKNTDGTGGYDLVIIESAQDFYLSFKNETTLTVNDIILLNSGYNLNDYENYEIYDTDGNIIDFADIPLKSILSVYESPDKKLVKFVVSAKTISGIVENKKIVDGKTVVTVGKADYVVNKTAEEKSNALLEAGANLTFYLNSFGEVALYEMIKPGKATPGWLVNVSVEDMVFTSRLMLKLCDSNGELRILYCDDEVEIDTKLYKNGEEAKKAIPNYDGASGRVTPQIILFETNADGDIKKIDTTNVGPEETASTSLVRNIKFGDIVVYGSQRLGLMAVIDPSNTTQFIVPEDERAAEAKNDAFVVGTVTLDDTGYYSRVESYRYRGDNVYEDIIVRKDRSAYNIDYNNTIMLIEEVGDVLNDECDVVKSISGYIKGAPVSYVLDSDCTIKDHNDSLDYTVNDIEKGDTVRVGEANGVVGMVEMIYDYSKGGKPDWCKAEDVNWYKVNSSRYYWDQQQISFGYIANIKDGIVEISYNNDKSVNEIYNQLNSVMIYDEEAPSDKAYIGNVTDLRSSALYGTDKCSRIIIQTYQGKYMGVVVYR